MTEFLYQFDKQSNTTMSELYTAAALARQTIQQKVVIGFKYKNPLISSPLKVVSESPLNSSSNPSCSPVLESPTMESNEQDNDFAQHSEEENELRKSGDN